MKIKKILLLLCYLITFSIYAKATASEADTANYKNLRLDEVIVISNPKAAVNAFQTPSSISLFNSSIIEKENLTSIKDFSSLAPNFFIPDYGSKLTTAIYIRGIGTRTNNSVVGLYVDNIPYLDKSIFDFDLLEIERMEILRGPQSTLYGRNTMAGLINIYTKSPFDHHFTRASVSYGNYNSFRVNLSRYGKINDKLAYSLSGQYQSHDGYFKNIYNDAPADSSSSTNGRIQFYYKPNSTLKINLSSNIEYSCQAGYAYGIIDEETNDIKDVNYNDPASYKRLMSASSIFIEKKFDNMLFTSATGYQYFDDDMKLDQDFTPSQIFTLNQKQRQNSISEEIILKSQNNKNFKWLAGFFGFYQNMHTDAPVNLKKDGIQNMINANIKIPEISMGPTNPNKIAMYDSLRNDNMLIKGVFKTPVWGAALFSKLTYDNFIIDGLSISAGARLNYEHSCLDYNTSTTAYADGGVKMITPQMAIPLFSFSDTLNIGFKGKKSMEDFEVLPRFDIVYSPCSAFMVYGNISKGYRAGGYNFQMFSDIVSNQLKGSMIQAFIDQAEKANMGDRIPESVKEMAQTYDIDIENQIQYKPEFSWNYEIGTRMDLFNKRLMIEASAFYIDVTDQQVSAFSATGLGRITKNSGKSRSIGAEAGIRFFPISNLSLIANYGYTNAKFIKNENEVMVGNEIKTVDYKDNYVPFAPEHTFSFTANYSVNFNNKFIDNMNFNINYSGAGRIYWIEDNSAYQDFYGTINGRVSARKGILEIAAYGRNLTNEKYQAFYFQSMGNKLAQKGNPLTFGGELIVRS